MSVATDLSRGGVGDDTYGCDATEGVDATWVDEASEGVNALCQYEEAEGVDGAGWGVC